MSPTAPALLVAGARRLRPSHQEGRGRPGRRRGAARRAGTGPHPGVGDLPSRPEGTLGAALAIARFDPATGRLACIGVGNFAAQLIQGGRVERPGSLHGVVGATVVVARAASVEQAAEVR